MLNAMRNFALLVVASFLCGCTVSANNHHFQLEEYSSKTYDEFSNTWCFVSSSVEEVTVCSSPYERHSKSIGVLVPIVPQTDRESRLAYDIVRERIVEFKNSSSADSVVFSLPAEFEQCTDRYAKNCAASSSLAIEPEGSAWIKVPAGSKHKIGIAVGENKFKVILLEFIDSRWHSVSV